MKPSAMACQSGPAGNARPLSSRRRRRQRTSRKGKANVARTTAPRSGPGRAAAIWRSTSKRLTPRRAQRSRPTDIPRTRTAGRDRRNLSRGEITRPGGLESGFGKRERNEVEQLLKQRLQGFQTGVAGELGGDLVANDVGPFQSR